MNNHERSWTCGHSCGCGREAPARQRRACAHAHGTGRDALIPALCSMEALSGDRLSMFIKHPNAHNVGPARWLRGVRALIYTLDRTPIHARVDVWGWKRPIRRHAGRVLMCTEWDASTAVPTMQRASQHEISKELTARFFEFPNRCSISISTSTLI